MLFGFAHVGGGLRAGGGMARRAPPARVAWLPTYSAYGVCNSKWRLVTAVGASVERARGGLRHGWRCAAACRPENGAGTEEPWGGAGLLPFQSIKCSYTHGFTVANDVSDGSGNFSKFWLHLL